MEILKTSLIGLFFGTFGTTLGGIIGVVIKRQSNKFLSFILAFASGLMMAVICFDLLPEALGISNITQVILGTILGIVAMIFCDVVVERKFSVNNRFDNNKNSLLKTGIIVSIGLAIHNFPEGLAIGSGFEASIKLGLSLAIAICLHDIPEGISMAVPMKKRRNENIKNYFLCYTIWNNHRDRSFFWSNCRFNIRANNSSLLELCCRRNVIYSFPES